MKKDIAADAAARAKTFCAENLHQCAVDLANWDRTGHLVDGKLRELAEICQIYSGRSDLAVAKAMVTTQAIGHIAALQPSQINQITELQSALQACLAWIDAVPTATADALPAMPGFDRDWANSLLDT